LQLCQFDQVLQFAIFEDLTGKIIEGSCPNGASKVGNFDLEDKFLEDACVIGAAVDALRVFLGELLAFGVIASIVVPLIFEVDEGEPKLEIGYDCFVVMQIVQLIFKVLDRFVGRSLGGLLLALLGIARNGVIFNT
jgi:hypothetical protein